MTRLVESVNVMNENPADISEGITLVRSGVSSADASAAIPSLNPSGYLSASGFTDADNVFAARRAREIELCCFITGGTGRTCNIKLKAWPYPLILADNNPKIPNNPSAPGRHNGRGILVFDGTLVCGGNSVANINPITGAAVSSTTFYEADATSGTPVYATDHVKLFEHTNSNLRMIIDCQGYGFFYPEISAISAGSVYIGLRRVS